MATGLKQAVETVNDYNPLMKDFPLNDLLSATELDKIRQALMAIFTHLKKIRNTKYPIQRALRLVEAISRDLSSQLLKVLGTRKLMHVAYEEFEKVGVVYFFSRPSCREQLEDALIFKAWASMGFPCLFEMKQGFYFFNSLLCFVKAFPILCTTVYVVSVLTL